MPSAKELRDIAKELGLRGYSKMNKGQLTEAIESQVRHNKSEVAKVTESEPETSPTPAPAPKQKRTSNSPWVQFCREHSKEQGITYKEAMTKKDEYAKWKESRSAEREVVAEE